MLCGTVVLVCVVVVVCAVVVVCGKGCRKQTRIPTEPWQGFRGR
jgi:hypothetical protein